MSLPLTTLTFEARPSDRKIDFLSQKYGVSREDIEIAIAIDPTEKVYIEWLLRLMSRGRLIVSEKSTRQLRRSLEIFNRLKDQPIFDGSKDINTYTSPQALLDCLEDYRDYFKVPTEIQKRELKSDARIVIRTNNFTWYEVINATQAKILSSGTPWCTIGENHADGYLAHGRLYVCYVANKPTLLFFVPKPGTTNPLYEFPDVANAKNEDLIIDFKGIYCCLETRKYLEIMRNLQLIEGFPWTFVSVLEFAKI